MRSTICTSGARANGAAGLTAALALTLSGAAAQAAPLTGCFARDYTAAHLAAQPQQVVQRIRVALTLDEGEFYSAWVTAQFARQGRVKGGPSAGAWHEQMAICDDLPEGIRCGVECDGGVFVVTAIRADGIDIATRDFWMNRAGDAPMGCEGTETLVETMGAPVTYRLYSADPALCGEMEGG